MSVLGSRHPHNWGLASIEYGRMLTDALAPNEWYSGNLEFVGALFGAGQYRANRGYAGGLAPMLRYNFATGCRWVPFLNLGAGVTWTSIRDGNLSTAFEFNLQAGAGVNVFLRQDLALSLEYRFIHLSNAGLNTPNLGVNTSNCLLGVSWFF